MILSKELNAQLERFSRTRSCSLGSELKNELALVLFETNGKRLNKSCGTCIRNAMQDVLNFMAREVRLESFIVYVMNVQMLRNQTHHLEKNCNKRMKMLD